MSSPCSHETPPKSPPSTASATLAQHSCSNPLCTLSFFTAGGLQKHYLATGHRASTPDVVTKCKQSRNKRTNTVKRDTLVMLDNARLDPAIIFPQTWVALETGISKGLISTWDNHERHKIFESASTHGHATKRTNFESRGGIFPIAEELLYGRFIHTRQVDQLRVGHVWLKDQMRDIVARLNPDRADSAQIEKFKAANGWASAYCKRWEISSQARTNNHTTPIAERLPAIQEFHQFLIYGMQGRLPARCPVYGRFPPKLMFHLDQVPLPFASATQKTLNPVGEQCVVKQPGGSGASKRFCTLQICICADADFQCVKPEIYFKGKGHIEAWEKEIYANLGNIITRFNSRAWSDEGTAIDALVAFREQTLHLGDVLLGMDGHKAQITPFCRAFMDLMGIRYGITTPNCTDVISPVDRHVGKVLKDKIHAKYEKALKSNARMWSLPAGQGGLSDARKRVLLATWTSEAWTELCRDNKHVITRAFVETGFLIAKDGSDRHEVRPYKRRKKRGRDHAAPDDEHTYSNVSPEGLPYDFGPPEKMMKK
jgi:hypothetical protein